MLKQKEIDFMSSLNEEWRRKDTEKDKFFKQSQASLQNLETKLKSKASELQKREQKIILLEEELKQRICEAAKQVF